MSIITGTQKHKMFGYLTPNVFFLFNHMYKGYQSGYTFVWCIYIITYLVWFELVFTSVIT